MSPDWISAISAAVGTLLIPLAVYFAALQWRQSATQSESLRNAVLSEMQQSLAGQFQEICVIMIEHPQLRKYFYTTAKPPPPGPELEQALVLGGMFIDFMDTTIVQRNQMPESYYAEWRRYFVDLFSASHLMREMWMHWESYYCEEVGRIYSDAVGLSRESHLNSL